MHLGQFGQGARVWHNFVTPQNSVLPAWAVGREAACLLGSYLWPEVNDQGTCIQFYKPTTRVWPLMAHPALRCHLLSSCISV